jgi:two-component sensor histidine kinase
MTSIVNVLREFDDEEDRIQTAREAWETQVRMWLVPALVAALSAACGLGLIWIRQERAFSAVLGDMNRTLESQVRERTAELDKERQRVEALLADMSHRIGNSLAMVSSFLALEGRRSPDANVRDALEEANRRVAAIASAQRRLRILSDCDEVALDRYLGDLAQDLRTTMFGGKVDFRIAAIPVTVSSEDAVAVGIILNELVTNALKHAFPCGQSGVIRVSLTREAESLVLCVADDGVGVDEDALGGEHSLGFLVIKSMVSSLNGDLRCRSSNAGAALPGTEWRLSFIA